ncbi:MAG TPA: UDP-glucose--hexose-1-phosphate uridylyltransferase [Longimicrobiales bacterium]
MTSSPHRRRNALNGEWVLVSPQRMGRPWQGRVESSAPDHRGPHDPNCPLCPGSRRAAGLPNPPYTGTFAFTNDFPALSPETEFAPLSSGLLEAATVRGTSRVLCYSPHHHLTLAEMSEPEIASVIELWCSETEALGRQYRWVQVFENKGELMGCSNPHPHGQVWALDVVPTEPAKEDVQQRAYTARNSSRLLIDYLEEELRKKTRVVVENDDWVALVPFWATWPFELLLLPRAPVCRLPDLTEPQKRALTDALQRLLVRYDNLFETSFPYSMGWHGAPYSDDDQSHWQLHAHFYPPLLRSATVQKFMVGFEFFGEAQRDLTPEAAAERLRALPDEHYRKREA